MAAVGFELTVTSRNSPDPMLMLDFLRCSRGIGEQMTIHRGGTSHIRLQQQFLTVDARNRMIGW